MIDEQDEELTVQNVLDKFGMLVGRPTYHAFLTHDDLLVPVSGSVDPNLLKRIRRFWQSHPKLRGKAAFVANLAERPIGLVVRRDDEPYLFVLFFFRDNKIATAASRYLELLATQLSLFVGQLKRRLDVTVQARFATILQNLTSKNDQGWQEIIDVVKLVGPKWGCVQLTPPPAVSLFLYRRGDAHLRIVASSDFSYVGQLVPLDNSLAGLAIKREKTDYVLVNPNNPPYESMAFSSGATASELVIPITADNDTIGVLSFEHERQDAFTPFHVNAYRMVADRLAPILRAFQSRYDAALREESALLYVLSGMFQRIANTYRHAIGTPILTLRFGLQQLRAELTSVNSDSDTVSRYFDRASDAVNAVVATVDNFVADLPEFISYRDVDVVRVVEDRVNLISEGLRNERIAIEVVCRTKVKRVYGSGLMAEHITNILENSRQAVTQRIFERAVASGWISIAITETSLVDHKGRETGLEFVNVIITDNGGGVPDDILPRIGWPGFTTKGAIGSGFGLAAAHNYFRSVGGDVVWNNKNDGFEVTIRIPVFSSEIHETRIRPVGR